MQMPRNPPQFSELWQQAQGDQERLLRLIGMGTLGPDGRYVHWDKLIHLTPPEGLTHKDWWLSLKLARIAAAKKLPLLRDKDDGGFGYTLADPIPELLHEVDLGAGGRIEMPSQITNAETKDQYYVESLIEEAITSSQLEGATTTRRVAEQLIRSGRRPSDRSETMIFNNYLTMKKIASLKAEVLTPELVLDIHKRVTRDTLDDADACGRLRSASEEVVISDDEGRVFHRPPHADELKERLERMCAFANGAPDDIFIHPVLRAVILHFWLGYDHPFVDGNGRCARALFYWSMLHHGYWLCEFISISQILLKAPAKYGRSFLHTETDDNDLTYFILYHLDVIQRSVTELHDFIAKRTGQLRNLESRVRNLGALNHRQRALLSHALRHPGHEYSIITHRTSHNVVYETSRTDLLELRDLGMLTADKRDRTWVFSVPEDLEERLSS
ncbi:MAG: filamentation induced by cAMP protein fic [Gemmatimonadaceae bacterium]|jgi:Fic family protein|nr:filamentation induced by cAMP protein fic [Gemmatimonadaceae bacterium]